MVSIVTRVYRRLRFGAPIVVVSGLPRSGTSMAMKALEAGGLEVVTDGIRTADESNPKGYFELERVKSLNTDADHAWLMGTRGKAIKIICFLLTYLPETNHYQVIFMHRNLDEVLASQNKMLVQRGESTGSTNDDQIRGFYEQHLKQVRSFISVRRCFEVLDVEYAKFLADPRDQAVRIREFLRRPLDVDLMADAADRQLHRNRR
jgi:Sulfotransferase family